MEADSAHGNIERELKRRLTANSRVPMPSAAMEAIANAIRSGYETHKMYAEDRYDCEEVYEQLMGNKSVPQIMKVRGISFTRVCKIRYSSVIQTEFYSIVRTTTPVQTPKSE